MSRIQDNGCDLGSQGFGYWYWVSSTPMIRMNFGDVSSSTSIEESKNGLVQIYPNPTQGILNITLADSKEYTVTIENLLGKVVYSDIISESLNNQINISNYKKGIYVITVSDGENSYTDKIIFE